MKDERVNNEIIIEVTLEEIISKILIFFIICSIVLYYLIMIFINYFFLQINYYFWILNSQKSWGLFNFLAWFINYLIFFLKIDILILIFIIFLELFSKNKERNIIIYWIVLLLTISPIILLTIWCIIFNWGCKFM